MRHLRGHFRQDLADPAHFVLVRTCKGHIPLDITNSSTSQAPASSNHFSRILRSCSPPAGPCGLPDPQILPLLVPERQIREFPESRLEAGIPASAPGAPREAGFPSRRRNSRSGAGIPSSGTGIPAPGQGNPGFPTRSGNPEFPGAGQEFLLRRAPRGDPPSEAVFQ